MHRLIRPCLAIYEDLVELRDMEDPPQVFVIATGGCSRLQSTLWTLPGASSFLVGAEFPYNQGATERVLGYTPDKFVSPETAAGLAQAAYLRALDSKRPGPRVGLGITCSVTSLHPHRGEHRLSVVAISDHKSVQSSYVLPKTVKNYNASNEVAEAREYDDLIAEVIALKCLFAVTRGGDFVTAPEGFFLEDAHDLNREVFMAHALHGAKSLWSDGSVSCNDVVLVPTSANPLHEGHVSLAKTVSRISGRDAIFCITVDPPHKPALTTQEMLVRMHGMSGHAVLFSSGDPLYIDKARNYPGAAFAIGADAFDRMLDPKWCPVIPMLEEFKKLNTRFYVRGRLVGDQFRDMHDILAVRGIPWEFWTLFTAVPGRYDISSTQLRNLNEAADFYVKKHPSTPPNNDNEQDGA